MTAHQQLTHFDAYGQAHMVDVGAKAATHRVAIAQGRIVMNPATLAIVLAGSAKKGLRCSLEIVEDKPAS